MHESGKSDGPVVPAKSSKMDYWEFHRRFVEAMEGRGPAKENERGAPLPVGPAKQVDRTQSRLGEGKPLDQDLHSALDRVRQAACRDKQLKFTSLWHHVYNVDGLREAYLACKRDAAAGIDGQTWQAYGEELESNLKDLSERLAQGRYRAKPVKRAYVPKADGKQRPIGILVLEDKIVQRAAVQVLNAVYETDFLGLSYGFRPKRSAHMALDALAVGIRTRKVNYVLDADIRGFFDTLNHGWLMQFVGHRIADKRVLRHIQKWLSAGVLEDGKHMVPEEGTPQGGSISPLLANIYLHYVFDLWVDHWRRTQAHGDVITMHHPVAEVGQWLGSVLRGHYRYYGVPLNYASLARFRRAVWCLWRQVLRHRSQSARTSMAKMGRLATRWLPRPCICQPYPEDRLLVMIRGKSPVR